MINYIAKDSFFADYIFSIGYYLTLQAYGDISDMFPSYKHSVVDTDSNSNSKIAETFERKWETLYEMEQNYLSHINEFGGIFDGTTTFSICDIYCCTWCKEIWFTEVRRFTINKCSGLFNERRMGFEIM